MIVVDVDLAAARALELDFVRELLSGTTDLGEAWAALAADLGEACTGELSRRRIGEPSRPWAVRLLRTEPPDLEELEAIERGLWALEDFLWAGRCPTLAAACRQLLEACRGQLGTELRARRLFVAAGVGQ